MILQTKCLIGGLHRSIPHIGIILSAITILGQCPICIASILSLQRISKRCVFTEGMYTVLVFILSNSDMQMP
jgi:hypothetical protein